MSHSPNNSFEAVAYLALGSNLGDRQATIRSAVAALNAHAKIEVVKCSTLHQTEPVGPAPQPRYINAAVMLRTSLSPGELLNACLSIELAHGRQRTDQQRWAARTLDIDLLLYDDRVLDEAGPPRLRVPHPRMAERLFVLEPLAEIAADVVHPVLKVKIADLRNRLKAAEYQPRSACI